MSDRPETISRKKITVEQAQAIKDHHWARYEAARRDIREARAVIQGDYAVPVPLEAKLAGVSTEAFAARLPHETTVPQKTLGLIGARKGEIKRFPTDGSVTEDDRATRIERWTNAGMDLRFPAYRADDLLLNEGQCGLKVWPSPAGWERRPTPYEDGAEERFKKAYARDSKDRPPNHDHYSSSKRTFKADASRSSRAYQKTLDRHLAQYFPIEIEACSLMDSAPINPRFVGDGVEIDGLVEERTFLKSELIRRKIRWVGDAGRLWEEDREAGDVKLIAIWLYDEEYVPFVAYFVDDGGRLRETYKVAADGRDLVDHVIDFRAEWGLARLPVFWEYGWCWPGASDVNKRGIPFAKPFGAAFKAASAMASGIVAHTWLMGYGGWFVRRKPGVPFPNTPGLTAAAMAEISGSRPDPVSVPAFGIVELDAEEIIPAVHAGPSPMAAKMMEFLLGTVEEQGTPAGAFGAAGAASAVDRTLMQRQVEQAMAHVMESRLRLRRKAASSMLEIGCMMGRGVGEMEEGIHVPIYKNVDVPLGSSSSQRQIVTLDPDDVGELYDVEAIYPTRPGDNLALMAQYFQFYKEKGITWNEWREWAIGDKAPSVARGQMIIDAYYQSPLGMQEALEDAAGKLADRKFQERLRLMSQGDVDPRGMPQAALAGLQPPEQAPRSWMDAPPPGNQSLAGAMGGAINSSRRANALMAPQNVPGV
jgi:hypothetical protein